MNLRNKKTGELGYLQFDILPQRLRVVNVNNDTVGEYKSLAELNAVWEDYEEPKEYWRIDCDGTISHGTDDFDTLFDNACKSLGNYFETKEEAEKAVEKLKAWKRLKDKGLTFCGWKITDDGCSVNVETTLDAEIVRAQQKFITDGLDLLFGGEE